MKIIHLKHNELNIFKKWLNCDVSLSAISMNFFQTHYFVEQIVGYFDKILSEFKRVGG